MSENKIGLVDIFRQWTESMTMHGFPNIFRSKYVKIRIMWIILFLASNAFCFYIISRILINYFKYEVVTTVKIVEKDSLPFPAVTVCNINPFITEDGLKYVTNELEKNNLTNFTEFILTDFYEGNQPKLFYNYAYVKYLTTLFSKGIKTELRKKFSIPFEKMFLSCIFKLKVCDVNDWEWYYDSSLGNCYRFNTGKNSKGEKIEIKNSIQPGYNNGLRLELFVGIPNSQKTLSSTTGAHISIDDNSFIPSYFQGVGLAPGFSTNLILERVKNQQAPQPYSECSDSIDSFDSEYYRKVIKSNLTYRQTDCFDVYYFSEVYKKCNCNELGYNFINESNNFCDTIEEQICASNIYVSLINSNFKNEIKSLCPLKCDTISFGITKSEHRYPSVSYANDLIQTNHVKSLFENRSNISIEELRESLLSVNVYYEHIRQTELTQNPSVTWDGLIASIGGTMGLFLGISFLSLAEVIDLFIQIMFRKISNVKNKISIEN